MSADGFVVPVMVVVVAPARQGQRCVLCSRRRWRRGPAAEQVADEALSLPLVWGRYRRVRHRGGRARSRRAGSRPRWTALRRRGLRRRPEGSRRRATWTAPSREYCAGGARHRCAMAPVAAVAAGDPLVGALSTAELPDAEGDRLAMPGPFVALGGLQADPAQLASFVTRPC